MSLASNVVILVRCQRQSAEGGLGTVGDGNARPEVGGAVSRLVETVGDGELDRGLFVGIVGERGGLTAPVVFVRVAVALGFANPESVGVELLVLEGNGCSCHAINGVVLFVARCQCQCKAAYEGCKD